MPTKIFVNLPVKDLARSTERVGDLAGRALTSGGSPAGVPMEQGGMYGRSFSDPGGHLWEVFHMDPAAVPSG